MTDKPENETEAPPKEVWHPHYDDPVHRLVLKSSDNVLFRVSGHHLGRASPVFAEMFDLALEAAEPVDMLVSTKVLCDFVYRTTCPYSEEFEFPQYQEKRTLTLNEAFDLYHLGTRFECPLAEGSGINHIDSRCLRSDGFWNALIRASNEDDQRLAKIIVGVILPERLVEVDPFPLISQLKPAWQHSLLRSIFGVEPHRKFQLDMKKYQGLPGDFDFQKPDKTYHFTAWRARWDPNGKSDAELLTDLRDKDRGYVFPFETAEKPEHHASMAKGAKDDAAVPNKQHNKSHINTSNEKIASVSASKSGDSGITPDQHSTQQNPSARKTDQPSMLSTAEYPSTDPSALQKNPSQAVEQTSPKKRKNDIEESRGTKVQRTSSESDAPVTGHASSGSILHGYWRLKVRPSASQQEGS